MTASHSHLIIVNPTAGAVRRGGLRRALDRLQAAGVPVVVRETQQRGDAEKLAAAAVTDGEFASVIAAGGDGTIGEIVNGLRRQGVGSVPPLGILPLGTANVLAGELQIDRLSTAVAAIAAGRVTAIYPGQCNGRYFVQMAGVGFDAQVVAELDTDLKRRLGKLAYVWQSLVSLRRYRPQRFDLIIDGVAQQAASAVVAKGHFYAGRFVLAPDIRPDQPKFQLCLFQRGSHGDVLLYAAAMSAGLIPRMGSVTVLPGQEIDILAPVGAPVQADGDIIATLPVRIRLEAHPLMVLA